MNAPSNEPVPVAESEPVAPESGDQPARAGTLRANPLAESERSWRQLVAIALVAGDLSPLSIARYGRVHPALAAAAIDVAIDEGVIVDGQIDPGVAASILVELDPRDKARIHAGVARHLMAQGQGRLIEALEHAQAAGELVPIDEQVAVADHAGRTALSISDYDSAHRLFSLADRLDLVAEPERRVTRLRDLAYSLHGLGRVSEARDFIARAFDLAERLGDTHAAAQLAVMYGYPVDWYAGDLRASALLQRAEAMSPEEDDACALLAARAAIEMRIPIPTAGTQQMAWITRSSLAQPFAEQALTISGAMSPLTRLMALLSWRTTHRAPVYLEQRLELSQEALDLSQALRLADRQVDAALMLAVDALESADRPLFERALSVARWVAERDGNPRLGWHTHTVASRAALLDGDLIAAEQHRMTAASLGASIDTPGWVGADLALAFQLALERNEPEEITSWLVDDDHPAVSNPIGRLCLARVFISLDQTDRAIEQLRRAVRLLDSEGSLLQQSVHASYLAVELGCNDLIDQLDQILLPWADRYAVDSNAWWCDGPVSLALAAISTYRGEFRLAVEQLDLGVEIARKMSDNRSLRLADEIRSRLPATRDDRAPGGSDGVGSLQLSDREIEILHLIVRGYTNQQISEQLAFSISTIRSEISAMYRKLGVRSRSEAVAQAIHLGLI